MRVRTERFLTNVAFENLPLLCVQITFYFVTDDLETTFVFWGTMLSSMLSMLFSGAYYVAYRSKTADPRAISRFSFQVAFEHMQPHWIHYHWQFQTAISKAFQVASPLLIIIDSCRETSNFTTKSINISGRILIDVKESKIHYSSRNLHGALCKEFNFALFVESKVWDLEMDDIEEYVYDYKKVSTLVAILCCCCPKKQQRKMSSIRVPTSVSKKRSVFSLGRKEDVE